MNYTELKNLDAKTLKKITEGLGPSDECLCSLLSPEKKGGFMAALKKLFAKPKKKACCAKGPVELSIPVTFSKDGNDVYIKKVLVKHNSPCGKCGCAVQNVSVKNSLANLSITPPDLSVPCSCSPTSKSDKCGQDLRR